MLAEVGQNFSSLIPGQLEARQCSGMVVVWWEPPSQESMYEQKVILYKSWFELSMHIWIFFTSFIMQKYNKYISKNALFKSFSANGVTCVMCYEM